MGCSGCNTNIDLDRPAMLGTYDWLSDIPDTTNETDIVEIRFKGTRKEFFRNEDRIPLKRDELVVVSCSPGHDVGAVSLTGKLAEYAYPEKMVKAAQAYEEESKDEYNRSQEPDQEVRPLHGGRWYFF